MTLAFLLLGLAVLSAGAELLVRGASRLAELAGISSLVVGLTVVAYGTSAPELVVSIQSAWSGKPDVALGNVVGSNIFNVLFILGLSAIIVPLRVSMQLIRLEVPLMIVISGGVLWMASDRSLSKWDGLILVAGLAGYTGSSIRLGLRDPDSGPLLVPRAEGENPGDPIPAKKSVLRRLAWNLACIAAGLVLLVLGSRWFIDSAIQLARFWGASELIIGLTLVAAGTSLPEVATSILAAARGERDIAVGNVIGSNLFNLLGVLGISCAISPNGICVSEMALWQDIPIMIGVAIACLPIFYTGHMIARWEGGLFLAYYGIYLSYLFAAAKHPDFAAGFRLSMLLFVLPLTLITLLLGAVRQWAIQDETRAGQA